MGRKIAIKTHFSLFLRGERFKDYELCFIALSMKLKIILPFNCVIYYVEYDFIEENNYMVIGILITS